MKMKFTSHISFRMTLPMQVIIFVDVVEFNAYEFLYAKIH
jgi:hypothetical protein